MNSSISFKLIYLAVAEVILYRPIVTNWKNLDQTIFDSSTARITSRIQWRKKMILFSNKRNFLRREAVSSSNKEDIYCWFKDRDGGK